MGNSLTQNACDKCNKCGSTELKVVEMYGLSFGMWKCLVQCSNYHVFMFETLSQKDMEYWHSKLTGVIYHDNVANEVKQLRDEIVSLKNELTRASNALNAACAPTPPSLHL